MGGILSNPCMNDNDDDGNHVWKVMNNKKGTPAKQSLEKRELTDTGYIPDSTGSSMEEFPSEKPKMNAQLHSLVVDEDDNFMAEQIFSRKELHGYDMEMLVHVQSPIKDLSEESTKGRKLNDLENDISGENDRMLDENCIRDFTSKHKLTTSGMDNYIRM